MLKLKSTKTYNMIQNISNCVIYLALRLIFPVKSNFERVMLKASNDIQTG